MCDRKQARLLRQLSTLRNRISLSKVPILSDTLF